MNPIADLISAQGFVCLDGGLATELENLGCDLNDPLWSARVLLESPETIATVVSSYLAAGADSVSTATYQATFAGLADRGLSDEAIVDLMHDAVDLVCAARDRFWVGLEDSGGAATTLPEATPDVPSRAARPRPIVAASIGPYGAYLADGSEYRGDYGLSVGELYDFHAARWAVLASSSADLLACETTPSYEETLAYCRLAAVSGRPTWISFQCRDETRIADGSLFAEVVAICADEPNVVAVGVNCTSPELVSSLVKVARGATDLPVLVYPNSGERWNAETKTWEGAPTPTDWTERTRSWLDDGASGVGGCCRVAPSDIRAIRGAAEVARGRARST